MSVGAMLGPILVIDDDRALLDAFQGALRLRMPRLQVDACDSPRGALERIAAQDYSAIISDVCMPQINGITLLTEVGKVSPCTPVMLMTAAGDQALAIRALQAGAYDFIFKPLDRDELIDVLERALETHELRHKVEVEQATVKRLAGLLRALEARVSKQELSVPRDEQMRARINRSHVLIERSLSHLNASMECLHKNIRLAEKQLQESAERLQMAEEHARRRASSRFSPSPRIR